MFSFALLCYVMLCLNKSTVNNVLFIRSIDFVFYSLTNLKFMSFLNKQISNYLKESLYYYCCYFITYAIKINKQLVFGFFIIIIVKSFFIGYLMLFRFDKLFVVGLLIREVNINNFLYSILFNKKKKKLLLEHSNLHFSFQINDSNESKLMKNKQLN